VGLAAHHHPAFVLEHAVANIPCLLNNGSTKLLFSGYTSVNKNAGHTLSIF